MLKALRMSGWRRPQRADQFGEFGHLTMEPITLCECCVHHRQSDAPIVDLNSALRFISDSPRRHRQLNCVRLELYPTLAQAEISALPLKMFQSGIGAEGHAIEGDGQPRRFTYGADPVGVDMKFPALTIHRIRLGKQRRRQHRDIRATFRISQ